MLLHFLGVNLIFWSKVEITNVIFTKITCGYEEFIVHDCFRILMGTWVL